MSRHQHKRSATGHWALATVLLNTMVLKFGLTVSSGWYWAMALTLPVMIQALLALARERRTAKS